ncbi:MULTISPECIES: Arc family DNA-binding protein [Aeromonas]|uniref:Arc family DNA-binding protein n=1 Tax=Aeromonas TaxID=642 RepID=UPI001C2355F2|nr:MULTISPECIES: Arc family DNA-binding protein [Aeromonas]MDX7805706.1 Arc family DNA-binding protein [Aeromonas caviae]QXB96114.1 Arc family DNA-binding protein [Aeromonas sp. FDAARGOS 1406]
MIEDKVRNTSLRLPREIRDWLTNRAVDNCRSFNGEITMILKQQMERERDSEKAESV